MDENGKILHQKSSSVARRDCRSLFFQNILEIGASWASNQVPSKSDLLTKPSRNEWGQGPMVFVHDLCPGHEWKSIIWFMSTNSGVSSVPVVHIFFLSHGTFYCISHVYIPQKYSSSKNYNNSISSNFYPRNHRNSIWKRFLHISPTGWVTAPHVSPRLVQIRHSVARSATTGGAATGIPHFRRRPADDWGPNDLANAKLAG